MAQAFADDIASVSGTRAGLQRIIDTHRTHLALWKGTVNTQKSQTLVFLPEGAEDPRPGAEADGADLWRWGTEELSNTTSRYLGLELTADGRWNVHAVKARLKGFAALGACKQILTNRLITRTDKFAVVRSVTKPCVTYGSELLRASAVPTRVLEGPSSPPCAWPSASPVAPPGQCTPWNYCTTTAQSGRLSLICVPPTFASCSACGRYAPTVSCMPSAPCSTSRRRG